VVLEKDGEDQLPRSCKNEVLHGVMDGRNIVNTIKRRKASWIGHMLRRKCLLKHVIEEKIYRSDGKTRKKT
jgi:hypothetical protein